MWRLFEQGRPVADVIGLDGEAEPPGAEPLLRPVMAGGRRLLERPAVMELREDCLRAVAALPQALLETRSTMEYPVRVSPSLRRLTDELAGSS